jgi:hypothetical protein
MVLQTGYFDDSGSDAGSQYYVLAGFLATVDDWKDISERWATSLDREGLRYFKMKEAMSLRGQFQRGWTEPLRGKLIMELVEIVASKNPWRIECFVRQDLFRNFVKGILHSKIFNDPYFMLFYQIILSISANAERIGWNPDCDFVFDEQGELGDLANSKWDWVKKNIDSVAPAGTGPFNAAQHLGSPPIFRNDVRFRPLQAADMFAWLVRDAITVTPPNMEEVSRAALKELEGKGKILRLDIEKRQLMNLGASFLVGKARLDGHL